MLKDQIALILIIVTIYLPKYTVTGIETHFVEVSYF